MVSPGVFCACVGHVVEKAAPAARVAECKAEHAAQARVQRGVVEVVDCRNAVEL